MLPADREELRRRAEARGVPGWQRWSRDLRRALDVVVPPGREVDGRAARAPVWFAGSRSDAQRRWR